ncbi:MAG: glycerophosphodiester phosphodiesterase family protein [Pseudomonadota bacterium]
MQHSARADDTSAVAVIHDGHKTFLKWHRARRRYSDTVFTGRRIVEGLRLGASVEVDLQRHGSGGFAILHDTTLDRETSGTGPVAACCGDQLRTLKLRGNEGRVGSESLMLLEDLAALLSSEGLHPEARLQLDLKNGSDDLEPRDVEAFVTAVSPVAAGIVLSGGDANAVERLAAGVPEMPVGFDPCYDSLLLDLAKQKTYGRFVETVVSAMPRASMIYLHHRLVCSVADDGVNLIDAFHRAGKTVDAYTIGQATPESLPVLQRLISLGADQITTDDPEGVAVALKALQ